METSPIALHPKPIYQPRKPVVQPSPKFGGVVDGFSNLVGYIDSNRMLELMASDGIGMILPRSAMAFSKRGVDDGRETFLREFTGLIGNVLITGWFGYGMLKLLGNRVNAYNPHGVPLDAHIHASNLDAFSKLYHQALTESPDDPKVARKTFINKFMAGIASNNSQFMAPAQLEGIFRIQNNKHQQQLLRALLEKAFDETDVEKHLSAIDKMTPDKKRTELEKILKDHNGKLSKPAQEELADFFQPKTPELAVKLQQSDAGTLALHKEAELRIEEAAQKDPGFKEKLESDPAFRQRETSKIRLSLYKDTQESTKAFVKAADEKALNLGVTGTIDLHDPQAPKKLLSNGQSRKNTLKELKYFLEHYVDRATHEAKNLQKAKPGMTEAQIIEERLFHTSNSGLLGRFLPTAEDGLVSVAIKHKKALTAVPITLSVLAAGAFTFYNQYITTQKHGGKMFFPGEGNPDASANLSQPLIAQNQPVSPRKNFRPVMGFQQNQSSNGGVLA